MGDLIHICNANTTSKFNGGRVKAARCYRGMTTSELANSVNLKRQTISMYENGKLENPELINIKNISEALNFPVKFFLENGKIDIEESATYFRSLLTTSKKYRTEQEIKVGFISIIYKFLSDYIMFSPLNLPNIKHGTCPEEAANILREYWNLGKKPINNIVYLVEKNGMIVSDFSTSTGDVDAYSHKIETNDMKTFFIGYSKNKNTAARIHFDVAHELGHILLHDWDEDLENIDKSEFKQIEQEANDFAAAFLLPEEEFREDIAEYANQLAYYIELKKRWKVSIAAMVRRAYKLSIIDNDDYQRLMRTMQKKGIRKKEPLDDELVTSRPSLLKQSINLLLQEKVFSPLELIDELSSEYGLSLYAKDIEDLLGLNKGTLEEKVPILNLKRR